MISFFKKLRSSGAASEAETAENTVKKEEQAEAAGEVEETNTRMKLYFLPGHDKSFSQEEGYVLQFFISELSPIAEGQVAIDGYKIEQEVNGLKLTLVLRNNMDADISLERLPLVLQDANQNTVARSMFDMKETVIPAHSAVPLRFLFPHHDFLVPQADFSSWKVGFHMEDSSVRPVVSELDFEPAVHFSMREYMEKQEQQVTENIRKAIQETEAQINFIGAAVDDAEDGSLVVDLFLRNGRTEEVALKKDMAFVLRDAAGDVVAAQAFDLSQVKLAPKSVTRWKLVYDKESRKKQNPDFSEWSIQAAEHFG
ncbi:SLAP domain-containing protein [Aneurinibacillus thermoaerophilus]|uniref:SLAP domain-containing protein n=1 Tax=Aneurinibacillus thermoaerophilus TaxID=143495 RepID=UPI002E1F7F86|nr:SLAP domain-containing protein [Aneurinibacillus thermoaerophilus]